MSNLKITSIDDVLVFEKNRTKRKVYKNMISVVRVGRRKALYLVFPDGHREDLNLHDEMDINGKTSFQTIEEVEKALDSSVFNIPDLDGVTSAYLRLENPNLSLQTLVDDGILPLTHNVTVIDAYGERHSFEDHVVLDNTWTDCSELYLNLANRLNEFKGVSCGLDNIFNVTTGVAPLVQPLNTMCLNLEIAANVKIVIERRDAKTGTASHKPTLVSIEEKDGMTYHGMTVDGTAAELSSCFYKKDYNPANVIDSKIISNEWIPNSMG